MKKIATLALCIAATVSMSAQKTVLKEAESAMKSGKPFVEVEKIITPAFTNAETANLAETYYIPGQAGIKEFNDLLGKRQLGLKFPEDGAYTMAKSLVGAYDYYMKALPLDSVADAKGKIKTKYSKGIVNDVIGHYADFNVAAIDMFNAKDFKGAYRAWEIFLEIPEKPAFNTKDLKVAADTLLAEIAYNQALAAWQADENDLAVKAFRNAIAKGYVKPHVFEYGISVATAAKDYDALLEFASKGNELYGNENPNFINQIINYYLQTEKYDDAIAYLNNAIAANPQAQYFALRGIIYDNQNKVTEARADYEKAHELDADNALALFYLGRSLAQEAAKMSDDYSKADFDQYKATTLVPIYRRAVELLEKAYTVDPGNRTDILKVLDIIYYQIDDAAGQESVKERRMAD